MLATRPCSGWGWCHYKPQEGFASGNACVSKGRLRKPHSQLIAPARRNGIGLGLQRTVSNLFSDVVLLLDKSIKPGDIIEIG